jgi:hypothetical protein
MHQSPQKKLAKRRDKYTDFDLTGMDNDSQAERRLYRDTQPKARRFALRDDAGRDARWDRPEPGK